MGAINKQGKIRRKILLGYILLFLVSATAIFILYQGITQIVALESATTSPNIKLKRINKLLGSIYESENFSRNYFISRSEEDLLKYIQSSENIEFEVNSFRQFCKGNKAQETYLMEINHLLIEKRSIIKQLLDFNLSNSQDSLYKNALDEAYTSTYKHFEKPVVVHRTTTIKRDSVYKENKKQGFFQRLKNVFVHPKEGSKESLTKVNIQKIEQSDTISHYVPKPESVAKTMQKAFFKLKDKELEIRKLTDEKEINFLSNDRMILERVRSLVAQIETEELHFTNTTLAATQGIIKQSVWVIVALSVFALIMMSFFMYFISRDIARNNAYQKALKEAQLQAESLLKLKEQFVANISHEIRTPLSAIAGFSEQLQKTQKTEEKNSYASHIQQATEHLHQLVNQVLDLSKVQAGMLQLEAIPFKINGLLSEVNALFSHQAKVKNIDLIVDQAEVEIPILIGDPFRIRQILINLVGNALKFTDNGSVTVAIQEVTLHAENVSFEISVKDTGIGIPNEKLASIFEEFTQAEQGTTRQYGGTGLGLAIARKIALAMNGNIHVISELSKGSAFVVSLTLPIADKQDLDFVSDNEVFKLTSKPSILFVEDDAVIQLLIRKIMDNHVIEYEIVSNGEEALHQVDNMSFDMIFSDIHMPNMNGFELASTLRDKNVLVPIIALTAQKDKVETYTKSGFTDVLAKPFKEWEILKMIEKYSLKIEQAIDLDDDTYIATKENFSTFNPETLLTFVHQDVIALVDILETFVQNTQQDIVQLQYALKLNDNEFIANKAHKMLSMYKQLEINELIEPLEVLEKSKELELSIEDVKMLTDNLCSKSGIVLDDIRNYIQQKKED